LEKFEMKKTLVALAVLSSVTGAMADVVLSGGVDMAIEHLTSTAGTGGTTTSSNSMTGGQNEYSNIAVTATEDLGDGLTAKAFIDVGVMYSESGGADFTREVYVGISGNDFGTIRMGRMLDPLFLAFATNEPSGAPNMMGGNEGMNAIVLVQGIRSARRSQMTMYETPAFGGAKINLQYATENGTTWGESVGAGISFAQGAFKANYQYESTKNEAILDYFSSNTSEQAASSIAATSTTDSTKRQVLALGYDLGVAKLGFTSAKAEHTTASATGNQISVGIPLGAWTLSTAYHKATLNTSSTDYVTTGTMTQAKYGFSKRTAGYITMGVQEYADGSKDTRTQVGIVHNF